MSTHISSGADEVLASTAESGPEDPLDALLKQIVGGYFVLTDGQGSVSKWSEPAELLFGRPAQEILGQSFFGTLLDPALSAEAQSWKPFLETGEAPTAPGRVSVCGPARRGPPRSRSRPSSSPSSSTRASTSRCSSRTSASSCR